MSKRYGRNQKRRAREQIELLAGVAVSAQRHAESATSEVRRLRGMIQDWDGDIKRMLGAYSAFRGYPDSISVRHLPKTGQRMPVQEDVSISLEPMEVTAAMSYTVGRLHLMQFESKRDIVSLRQLMRTCFIDEGGRVAYALGYEIDGHVFREAVMSDRERRHLADQIAASMVSHAQSAKAA